MKKNICCIFCFANIIFKKKWLVAVVVVGVVVTFMTVKLRTYNNVHSGVVRLVGSV
jgi:hypothetical protein